MSPYEFLLWNDYVVAASSDHRWTFTKLQLAIVRPVGPGAVLYLGRLRVR